jgi:hypothetical protein
MYDEPIFLKTMALFCFLAYPLLLLLLLLLFLIDDGWMTFGFLECWKQKDGSR